jgi:molybdenum cofactor biosynthesis enzyme
MARSSTSFKPGWKGGPGRPKRQTEREYLDAAIARCTPERWQKIVDKALEQAEKGDATARAWVSAILIGKEPRALQEMVDELQDMVDDIRERMEVLSNGKCPQD